MFFFLLLCVLLLLLRAFQFRITYIRNCDCYFWKRWSEFVFVFLLVCQSFFFYLMGKRSILLHFHLEFLGKTSELAQVFFPPSFFEVLTCVYEELVNGE